MRDETLDEYIRKMNEGGNKELIFCKPLSNSVDYSKVWEQKPEPTDDIVFPYAPYNMYFIKNELNVYIAVVLDMCHDLHVYVTPENRKKGHLTKALKNYILPHLFKEREEQIITITEGSIGRKNFQASQKVALNLGFKNIGNNEYVLSSDDFQFPHPEKVGQDFDVSEDRIMTLKQRINYLAKSLWIIQTEVDMCFNDSDYAEELKDVVDDLKNQVWKIEDSWLNMKAKKR